MSRPIYLTEDIRRIEAAAGAVTPTLMARAGRAAADLALRLVPDQGKDVLVLAGPGNNGGDAYEVAVHLKAAFLRVTVVSPADPAKLPPDAAEALRKWQAAGGEVLSEVPADRRWSLVVDGLFGIGLTRAPEGAYAQLIEFANAQSCPMLALDIPSGLGSDTGSALGPVVRATQTISFIALKPGLLTLEGPDHCGAISVAELGLDLRALVAPGGWISEPATMNWVLKPRPREFHKGQAGSLAILGGTSGMVGAALLAGRAGLKLGAGRVYVGLLDHAAPGVDPMAPELMLRHPDDTLGENLDAVVVGPGLGQSERAETLVGAAIASEMPCVLDADALNILADNADLRAACARRRADTLITPHPGEAARLLETSTQAVQADRLGAARTLSERFAAHTVLKGNGSVLVARDGHWFINTSGNPGMASAGMGDTLAGFLGALLAQRYAGEAALVLGVHLHGAAADALVLEGTGPIGLTAGELIDAARRLWNSWLSR